MRWLSLLALLVGCRTPPYDPLAGLADGAVACTTSGHHYLEAVPLTRLDALERPPELALGRAIRLRTGIALREGCDVAGQIDAVLQPGNATDFLQLKAHRWRGTADAGCGPEREAVRILLVEGGQNHRLEVRDVAPGGTLGLTLALRTARPGCDARRRGEPCQRDCQCASFNQAARCIPTGASAGVCLLPCSEDADCAAPDEDGSPDSCADGSIDGLPPFHCMTRSSCQADRDCPFGQACRALSTCRPAQGRVIGKGCGCDAECGFGGLCRLSLDLGYCVIPCGSSAGCPGGHSCGSSQCFEDPPRG